MAKVTWAPGLVVSSVEKASAGSGGRVTVMTGGVAKAGALAADDRRFIPALSAVAAAGSAAAAVS